MWHLFVELQGHVTSHKKNKSRENVVSNSTEEEKIVMKMTARRWEMMSVTNLPRSAVAEWITPDCPTTDSMRWSQRLAKNHNFCLTHLHSVTLGAPRWNVAITLLQKNQNGVATWRWNFFKDIFNFCLFVIDGNPDRWTPHDSIGRT